VPHLIVKDFKAPQAPYSSEQATLLFASGESPTGVVGVEAEDHTFVLHWFNHPKGTLLKVDKTTRPPRLNAVKRALKTLAEASGGIVVHSTIDRFRPERRFEALIEADHFIAHAPEQPLWLEVGFGSGRHMLHHAQSTPDKLHLGIEIHRPSAEQLLRRAEDAGLKNIRVICADARTVLQTLPSASVERLFVHFPVPWDKAPDRRVFSSDFIEGATRVLTAGGTLELRTDSPDYFDYSLDLLLHLNHADLRVHKNRETGISSKYEDRWRRQQKDIFDLIYTNDTGTPPVRPAYRFAFEPIAIDAALEAISAHLRRAWVKKGALLKLRTLWTLQDGSRLLHLTMGACDAPQSLYLRLSGNQAAYFPTAPLPTEENYRAHTQLKEILHGA
jgi:tRNA (guanine-N7-)-methyltransferase